MAMDLTSTSQYGQLGPDVVHFDVGTISFWGAPDFEAASTTPRYAMLDTTSYLHLEYYWRKDLAANRFKVSFDARQHWFDFAENAWTVGSFAHFALSYNKTGPAFVMYINGTKAISDWGTGTWGTTSERSDTYFGNSQQYTTTFDGDVAELALWDTVLSDANVATLAAGTSADQVESGSLTGYWKLIDSGTATVGSDMTIVGSPSWTTHPSISYPSSGGNAFLIGGRTRIGHGGCVDLTATKG
jgi:hypothetical protein